MKRSRLLAILFLGLVTLSSLLAGILAPAPYARQFRDIPDAACSRQHPLGIDDLGRDRLSRLLYGTRVSLLLPPPAALVTSILSPFADRTAGFAAGLSEDFFMSPTHF